MPRPRPEALALAERLRLGRVAVPRGGLTGSVLGRGTGASLELEDRRVYAPGDDVRHLDWRAYARTDQLFVRVYREEVRPRLEVVLDASRSLDVEPEKAQRAVDLAALLVACARREGYAAVLVRAGDRLEPLTFEALRDTGIELDGVTPLPLLLRGAPGVLRPGAVRVVVSDFLFPHDADELARAASVRAGNLTLVQVLGAFDLDPPEGAALRLTDAERGTSRDLVLDAPTVRAYRRRLERGKDALADACHRLAATFVSIAAAEDLGDLCRGPLLEAGVLAGRGT